MSATIENPLLCGVLSFPSLPSQGQSVLSPAKIKLAFVLLLLLTHFFVLMSASLDNMSDFKSQVNDTHTM